MKIFVLVAAVCLAVSSNAQFRIGIKTGMNISNLRNDDLRDSDPLISGHIGAIADLPLGKSPFNIQGEVVYQQHGYKNSNIYATAASGSFLDVIKSHRISYIKVPLHLMYRMEADNAVFKAGLGPFFAFKTSDKLKVEGGDEYTNEAVLPVFVEKIRPVLTGISIQLNAEWKTFLLLCGCSRALMVFISTIVHHPGRNGPTLQQAYRSGFFLM